MAHLARACWIKVPAGTILMVRKRMFWGVAKVPLELEGVA